LSKTDVPHAMTTTRLRHSSPIL